MDHAWVSPSYGVKAQTSVLVFSIEGLRPLHAQRWLRTMAFASE